MVDKRVNECREEGQSEEWQTVASPPTATCKVRIRNKTTAVQIALDTAKQVPEGIELLQLKDNAATGLLPLFLDIAGWPNWFPCCVEASKLGEWDEEQFGGAGGFAGVEHASLWHLVYRIGPLLSVDTVVLAADRPGCLQQNGELYHYLWTPVAEVETPRDAGGAGHEPLGPTCLGVALPPCARRRALLSIRVPFDWSRTTFTPLARDRGVVEYSCQMVNLVTPIRWATFLFWKLCATRALGLMQRLLQRDSGLPFSTGRKKFYERTLVWISRV